MVQMINQKLNKLTLLSGNDIPFPPAKVSIHQPTLKEIGYIGETNFFRGCELLTFSKNNLPSQDKKSLAKYSDFDIIMSIINSPKEKQSKNIFISVLTLLFPDYIVQLKNNIIILSKENNEQYILNASMFESFKEILIQIFCLDGKKEKQYNPGGKLAQRIADKLKKGHEKVQKQKGKDNEDTHLLSQYVSILSTGLGKDINNLMEYTIPQLFDEYKRFEMKIQYDIYVKQKLAGAKDVKEVDFWMEDIY